LVGVATSGVVVATDLSPVGRALRVRICGVFSPRETNVQQRSAIRLCRFHITRLAQGAKSVMDQAGMTQTSSPDAFVASTGSISTELAP
jgi:hypothetical protein